MKEAEQKKKMFLVLIYRDWKARAGVSSSLFAFLSVWPRLNYRTACFDRHGRIPISRRPFSCRRRREGEGWTGTERGGGQRLPHLVWGFPDSVRVPFMARMRRRARASPSTRSFAFRTSTFSLSFASESSSSRMSRQVTYIRYGV